MNPLTTSQVIVAASKRLEQFLSVPGESDAICALTGVRVVAIDDPHESDHDMVSRGCRYLVLSLLTLTE